MSELNALIAVKVIGLLAVGGLFVWWQLRDVAKARRQSIAKALSQAAEKAPD
jgi:F0F1-type ATP synthase membrane subunit b/b'